MRGQFSPCRTSRAITAVVCAGTNPPADQSSGAFLCAEPRGGVRGRTFRPWARRIATHGTGLVDPQSHVGAARGGAGHTVRQLPAGQRRGGAMLSPALISFPTRVSGRESLPGLCPGEISRHRGIANDAALRVGTRNLLVPDGGRAKRGAKKGSPQRTSSAMVTARRTEHLSS